jgi:hypothetical protein
MICENELEMDRRNCPCLISPLEWPTWRGTPSKDVHCVLHHKTYRTLNQLLEMASHNYQAWFTSGEHTIKNCLQWLPTYYWNNAPQNFLKSPSVSARIDFTRPVPEKSVTHNSHMASDMVNKQAPKKRSRLNGRLHRSAQKHVNFSKHSLT